MLDHIPASQATTVALIRSPHRWWWKLNLDGDRSEWGPRAQLTPAGDEEDPTSKSPSRFFPLAYSSGCHPCPFVCRHRPVASSSLPHVGRSMSPSAGHHLLLRQERTDQDAGPGDGRLFCAGGCVEGVDSIYTSIAGWPDLWVVVGAMCRRAGLSAATGPPLQFGAPKAKRLGSQTPSRCASDIVPTVSCDSGSVSVCCGPRPVVIRMSLYINQPWAHSLDRPSGNKPTY